MNRKNNAVVGYGSPAKFRPGKRQFALIDKGEGVKTDVDTANKKQGIDSAGVLVVQMSRIPAQGKLKRADTGKIFHPNRYGKGRFIIACQGKGIGFEYNVSMPSVRNPQRRKDD